MSTDELKKAAEEAYEKQFESMPVDDDDAITVRHGDGDYREWSAEDFYEDGFLAGAAHAQRWIPVSERLPALDKLVLVCNPASIKPTYGWRTGDKQWAINDEPNFCFDKIDRISFVTHWLPLPPAPKEEK